MGSSPSKTLAREHQLFDKERQNKLLSAIKNKDLNKTRPNIVMLGPVGAGKSSFINALCSVTSDRNVRMAPAGTDESSFTLTYAGFKMAHLPQYIFRDTMGIEATDEAGIREDDLDYLIKGQIKNRYEFSLTKPVSENKDFFEEHPTAENVPHCVALVVSAEFVIAGVPEAYRRKIKNLIKSLQKNNIPRVIILTKADLICDKVKKDVLFLFKSNKVQDAVRETEKAFGIPSYSIHPVVNYESQKSITPKQNYPLLLALRDMAECATNIIQHKEDSKDIK